MQMQTAGVVCLLWSVCVCLRDGGDGERDGGGTKTAYMCCMLILASYLRRALVSHAFVIYHSSLCLGFGSQSCGDFFLFFPPSPRCAPRALSFTRLPRLTPLYDSRAHTAHCCLRHLVSRCCDYSVNVSTETHLLLTNSASVCVLLLHSPKCGHSLIRKSLFFKFIVPRKK